MMIMPVFPVDGPLSSDEMRSGGASDTVSVTGSTCGDRGGSGASAALSNSISSSSSSSLSPILLTVRLIPGSLGMGGGEDGIGDDSAGAACGLSSSSLISPIASITPTKSKTRMILTRSSILAAAVSSSASSSTSIAVVVASAPSPGRLALPASGS